MSVTEMFTSTLMHIFDWTWGWKFEDEIKGESLSANPKKYFWSLKKISSSVHSENPIAVPKNA